MGKIKEIIDVAVHAGKIMVENGSEIYRCEETTKRMIESYGIKDIDIFTLSTCIFVTCHKDDESYTCIKRVIPKTTDLSKISKVNQLSRDIARNNMDIKECKRILEEIENEYQDSNHKFQTAIAISIACALFGVMLTNCTKREFFVITVNTFINFYFLEYLNKYRVNSLLKNVLVSMMITFFAIISIYLGIAFEINNIIIGTIMFLVPGVAITNAVRDAVSGDILSGTVRLVEAITIASGIAIGVGAMLFIYVNFWGGIL